MDYYRCKDNKTHDLKEAKDFHRGSGEGDLVLKGEQTQVNYKHKHQKK